MNQNLDRASIIECFHRIMEMRDRGIGGHCLRVADLAVELAIKLQLAENDIVIIREGALLHDIGLIGIPDSILFRPGPNTEDEKMVLRMHPLYGYRLLQPVDALAEVAEIVYCHHEQWNGTGYPRRLKRDEISRNVQIVSIVNVWDRLRMDKPYQAGMPAQAAKRYIKEQSCQMFDPELVEQFLHMVG